MIRCGKVGEITTTLLLAPTPAAMSLLALFGQATDLWMLGGKEGEFPLGRASSWDTQEW